MSTGVKAKAFLLSFIFICSVPAAKAAPWQINPFLKSLNGSVYEFKFLVEGLKSVHSFSFENSTKAQYQTFFNRMTLGLGVDDGARRIQVLDKLEPGDFGTVAHESFHAFKANFIDVKPEYKRQKLWMMRRAQIIFPDLPRAKAEVALEEAYAVFIESAIASRMNVGRIVDRITPEKCARAQLAESVWNVNWKSEIAGYYYRDGFGEYWADKFDALLSLLKKRTTAYDKVDKDRAIFEEGTYLSSVDKDWIAQNFLENKVNSSFSKTFEGSKQLLICAK